MSKIKELTEKLMQEFPTLTKKYCMRCAIVAGLIDEEFPGLDYGFFLNIDELVIIVCNHIQIFLREGFNWIDIKEDIIKTTRNKDTSNCGICYGKMTKGSYCKTCGKLTCADCFVKLIRMHQGIIKCSYCRAESGIMKGIEEFSQSQVELYILNYKLHFEDYKISDHGGDWG